MKKRKRSRQSASRGASQRPVSSSSRKASSKEFRRRSQTSAQTDKAVSKARSRTSSGSSRRAQEVKPRRSASASSPKAVKRNSTLRTREQAKTKRPPAKRALTKAELARRKKLRRLVLMLAMFIILIIVTVMTFKYVSDQLRNQAVVAENDPAASFSPVVCTSDMVDSSLDVNAPAQENSPITFTVSMHNTSDKHPCYIDVGRANSTIEISSGDDSLVSLASCEDSGKEHHRLLLDRDMTASFVMTWNRHRDAACLPESATALPGMYRAVWETQGESPLEAHTSFEIAEPPAPKPSEEPDENPTGGNPDETDSSEARSEEAQ